MSSRSAATLGVVAVLAGAFAGCVSEALVDASLPTLLAEPWRENWTTIASDFAFDADPDARTLVAEGTLTIRNDLGVDAPELRLVMEPFAIVHVRDERGADLPFEVEAGSTALLDVPDEIHATAAPMQVVTVDLGGDVAPGAVRTIALAYGGWGGRDQVVLGGGLPNDFATHRIQLHPRTNVVSNTGALNAPTNFTLSAPETWVVVATAEPVEQTTEAGVTTTRYTSRVSVVTAVFAKGLEWIEEDVGGVQLKTFFFPDMRLQGETTHDIGHQVLVGMPALTGPYPFEHLWTVPNQVAANAFSTPGLTFMGLNFYRATLPGVPVQFSRAAFPAAIPGGEDSYGAVVVHEHVHNWWGHNLRGNNTNTDLGPGEVWVTEGVTTYLSEIVWAEIQYGAEDAALVARDRGLDVHRQRVLNGGEEVPITAPGGRSYTKTAVALRALQAYAVERGTPDAVLESLRLAQDRYGRLQGGPGLVDTEQMIAVFEEVFGEDLRWHFDPWFYGSELSDFRVQGASRDGDNLTVAVVNAGEVPAAVQLKAVTATGQAIWAWGFVDGGATADVAVPLPAGLAAPIVRIEADPLHYVYEWDDTDNVWVGTA